MFNVFATRSWRTSSWYILPLSAETYIHSVSEQVHLPAGRNAQVDPYNDETDAAVEAVGGGRLVVGTVQPGRRRLGSHFRQLDSRCRGR